MCGGQGGHYSSNCYALICGTLEEKKSMKTARQNAGESRWKDVWMVTGGCSNGRLRSSEIYKNGVWLTFMDLLRSNDGHCQVEIRSKIIMAGMLCYAMPHKNIIYRGVVR